MLYHWVVFTWVLSGSRRLWILTVSALLGWEETGQVLSEECVPPAAIQYDTTGLGVYFARECEYFRFGPLGAIHLEREHDGPVWTTIYVAEL